MGTQLNGAVFESWGLASLAMVAPNLLLAVGLLAKSDVRAPYAASPAAGLGPTLRGMSRTRLFHASYFLTAAAAIIVVQAEGPWAPTLLPRDYGLSVSDSPLAAGLIVLFAAPPCPLGAGRVVAAFRHRSPVSPRPHEPTDGT